MNTCPADIPTSVPLQRQQLGFVDSGSSLIAPILGRVMTMLLVLSIWPVNCSTPNDRAL